MTQEKEATIKVPKRLRLGSYANAFRITEASGPDCFLDFITCEGGEGAVVSRVRVSRELLPSLLAHILKTLDMDVVDLSDEYEDSEYGDWEDDPGESTPPKIIH